MTNRTRWIISRFRKLACAAILAIVVAPAADGPVHATTLRAQGVTSPPGFDRFGARFLAAIVDRGNESDNMVFSPVSAGFTLSLAALGARGTTALALTQLLGESSFDRRTLEQRGTRTVELLGGRTDVQLELANAVWVDTAVRLSPSFAASVAAWKATASTLPLSSSEAVRTINRWADRSTHGRIKEVFRDALDPSTRLALTNAVYFKGKWSDAFDVSVTSPRNFTLASGRPIAVPAMERTGQLAYRRAKGFQVVRLPYRGGRTAMYVILPDSGAAVSTLVQQFAAAGWPTTLGAGSERDVHLVLPKFHVEQALDLRPSLETMGGSIVFDCDRADFGDLAVARSSGNRVPLCIDKATQKVYLDVNEEGTEAAAVTGMTLVDTAAPPPPVDFIVDRPFLFVLRDESSGNDLFVGIIRRPRT